MNVLPKDHEVTFILTEDARPDLGNKMNLLGVFLGGDIGLPPGAVPTLIPSLTLIFILNEGEGKIMQSAYIENPDGVRIVEFEASIVEKKAEQKAMVAFKLSPFPIEKFGAYKAVLKLDNRLYAQSIPVHAV